MVLRFKNQKEISLYFDVVDHLAEVVILKGQRVLLEKEHYGEIMEKFLTLNKDFLLFLCQDEGYGGNESENPCYTEFLNTEEMRQYYEQKLRFVKKDLEHRNFIRAFMFDYIFKTFI